MWRFKFRASKRLPITSIGITFAFASLLRNLSQGWGDMIGIICSVFFGMGMIIIACVFLIPSRDEIPTLEDAIKHSRIVWGLWFTGDRHFDLIQKHNCFKRILLMEPDSIAFKDSLSLSTDAKDSTSQIKKVTKRAIEKGIEVRWYSEPPQVTSLTIYDTVQGDEPNSEKSYFITTQLDKGKPRSKREIDIIHKTQDSNEFNTQINRFKILWGNSRVPKPEEYN
jgi:hypothetical protein